MPLISITCFFSLEMEINEIIGQKIFLLSNLVKIRGLSKIVGEEVNKFLTDYRKAIHCKNEYQPTDSSKYE